MVYIFVKNFTAMLQKFGEKLSPLQRCLDDVNDQAALFNSNNIIVAPSNINKIQDLNTRCVVITDHS